MAKKDTEKKVSVNDIDKILKDCSDRTEELGIETSEGRIEITVKHTIPFSEFCGFVTDVVDNCFDEDIYRPYVKEFAIRRAIITYFTNLREPSSPEKLYSLCMLDIMNGIIERISVTQLHSIYEAIDDAIDFRKRQILANRPNALDSLLNELTDTLNQIKTKFGDSFDVSNIMDIFSKLPTKEEVTNYVIEQAKEQAETTENE